MVLWTLPVSYHHFPIYSVPHVPGVLMTLQHETAAEISVQQSWWHTAWLGFVSSSRAGCPTSSILGVCSRCQQRWVQNSHRFRATEFRNCESWCGIIRNKGFVSLTEPRAGDGVSPSVWIIALTCVLGWKESASLRPCMPQSSPTLCPRPDLEVWVGQKVIPVLPFYTMFISWLLMGQEGPFWLFGAFCSLCSPDQLQETEFAYGKGHVEEIFGLHPCEHSSRCSQEGAFFLEVPPWGLMAVLSCIMLGQVVSGLKGNSCSFIRSEQWVRWILEFLPSLHLDYPIFIKNGSKSFADAVPWDGAWFKHVPGNSPLLGLLSQRCPHMHLPKHLRAWRPKLKFTFQPSAMSQARFPFESL